MLGQKKKSVDLFHNLVVPSLSFVLLLVLWVSVCSHDAFWVYGRPSVAG